MPLVLMVAHEVNILSVLSRYDCALKVNRLRLRDRLNPLAKTTPRPSGQDAKAVFAFQLPDFCVVL